jgi:ATP-dependent DNA helicase RecG
MPLDTDALTALTPLDRGRLLLSVAEDQWFDRKSGRVSSRDLANTLIGLANAEGGLIAVGLHDGALSRIPSTASQNSLRQAAVDHTLPTIRVRFDVLDVEVADQTGQVLLAQVLPSDLVHTNARDDAFLRVGDETRRLTFDQRRELEFDKGQSSFELTPTRWLVRDDLDTELLQELAERLGARDPSRLLVARGLERRAGELTVGAALLFAEHPEAELPEAHVRVLRYRGRERRTGRRQQIVEDVRIEGPLSRQIDQAREHVARLSPVRRALDQRGKFTDASAIPTDAWLEGVVNAVTHRSYSISGDHIRVEIFDDRIEITSPGRFPGVVDLDAPEHVTRFARNPRIARVLSDLGYGQELGEGVRRMFDEMRLAGLPEPEYRQTAGSVTLTLPADPVDRDLEARLSLEARRLLRSLRDAGNLSTGELVRIAGRSRPSVLRDLEELRDAGVVEWVGKSKKDPRAYWRLPT